MRSTQRISLVVIGCVLLALLGATAAFAQTPNSNCPVGSGEICSVPSSVAFANTYIGKASGNKTLTIYNNTTSGTIFIETIGFSCTTGSSSDFGIASGTVPFQMGTTQTLTHYSIFFQPRSAVAYNCNFVLTMLDGFVLDVPLTATGLSSSAVSSLSKTAMTFSNQGIGTTSTPQTVTITNTGTSTMNLEAINLSPPSFTTNTVTFPFAIKANASLTLSVYYTPSQVTSETGVLDLDYDAVPDNGVTLNGNGVADTTLAISSEPTLPQGTQGYAYQANLLTSGGTGPYTWSLASGSSLPPGLSISSAGAITGTISSSASITNPYTFTVQVSDNTTGKTATSLMNIVVLAYLGDGNGESCNDLSWNDPALGTPLLALNDLGTGFYQNSAYEGGLYPNGSNTRPASQDSYGVSLANQIQPLDANGNPSSTGKYVLMAVGESTAQNEFNRFLPMANADPAKNPNLVIVNGAQGGATPNTLTTTDSTYWTTVLENYLPQNGVTQNQVVAVWIEDTDGIASGTFPSDITDLQSQYETMMQTMLTLFPNLKLVYFSSRVYAGYSNGLTTPDNPEPYAYEVGFAVKWAIQDQINKASNLCDGNGCSPIVAPWMAWGTYYWSNGMLGRSDGLVWDCQDFSSDGTHPSSTYGQLKVATKLFQFLKTDDTATPWYLAATLTLSPTGGNGQSGNVGTALPTPLMVTAENTSSGALQSGVTVTFTDNGAGGKFNPASGITGSSGTVSTTYTLPSTAQTLTVTATATGYAAANFTETATASTQVLTATSGNNQSGAGGTTLPTPLTVTATNNGSAASGVTVNFTDGGVGGTFNPTSAVTGSNGTASTSYTLPSTAQTVTVTASATGYTSATFTETATAAVETLTATSGNNQSCSASGALPLPLVVTATTNGNDSSGVSVAFSDGGAGGSFNPASGSTGSNGQVQSTYTCPATGSTLTLTASATGYTSASFTETIAGSDVLSVAGGNNQSGPVGTKLAKSLEAKATINGVATAGVPVTFSDGGVGGTFGNPSGVTGSSGTIFTTYTLPSTAQTVTITATSAGYTSAVFTETATAAAEVLTATAGNNQTGAGGVQYPVALQVTATNNGTDQSGLTVTFSDNGAGGTFGTPSGVTGSNGTVTTTYTPKTVTQTTAITITASATGYTSATFSETATAAVQTLTATSGNNQSGSGQLPLPLVVTATSNGTDQSGVTVTFSDGGAGGIFSAPSGTTGTNGQVQTNYTCSGAAATVTITAAATAYTSATFTETCTATTKTLAVSGGNNQTGQTGTVLPTALTVLATSNGVAQSGISVTFNDNGAGGLFSPTTAVTNSSGIATTTYTLGKVGTITVTASATGYTSTNFTETSTGVLLLSASGGNNQTGTVGTTLPVPLSVTATNNGVVVQGVTVTITDNGAGGTLGTPSGQTNSSGVFSSTYTLPSTAKTVTLTASAPGYTSATFTETATASSTVTQLAIVAGGSQKGTVGSTLPSAIQVKARNAAGQGVAGATVTFTDGGAGGTFNPASGTTNSSGVISTSYTLPTKPKSITVTATSGTITAKATEQALAGAPADLNIISGNGQSGVEGKLLPKALELTVTDQYGNGLAGVTVNFTDNGAGGTFSSNGSVVTTSTGQASVTYTCGSKSGTITISATTSTLGPLDFTETVKK
jgi:hypothetical protein